MSATVFYINELQVGARSSTKEDSFFDLVTEFGLELKDVKGISV